MPTLDAHTSSSLVKAICIGDSGSGKTGGLASLVAAGYRLKIVDFDNGLDRLVHELRKASLPLSSVEYETCTDEFHNLGGKPVPKTAKAWGDGMNALTKFTKSMSPEEIIVIDSATFASKAAMRWILKLNARLTMAPYQSDWGEAQRLVEGMFAMLFDDSVKCNVIFNCHIKNIGTYETTTNSKGEKEEIEVNARGYPELVGRALSPSIARYVNTVVLMRSFGGKRFMRTNSFENIELKTAVTVKDQYPIETAWGDFFRAVRGDLKTKAAA